MVYLPTIPQFHSFQHPDETTTYDESAPNITTPPCDPLVQADRRRADETQIDMEDTMYGRVGYLFGTIPPREEGVSVTEWDVGAPFGELKSE